MMLGQREMTVEDYVGILRRRWWLMAIPALLGPAVGYGVSKTLPEQYTSQTLVLVERPNVPMPMVPQFVDEDFNLRLGTMQERILSRSRLQPVIEQHKLFGETGSGVPMEDLLEKTRKAIKVAMVRSTSGERAGVPGFTISVTYSDAHAAQSVCQQITSMFMDENIKLRADRASNTAKVLGSQLEDAKRKLDEQDQGLAQFKARHIGQMPGKEEANLGMLMSSNAQLDAVTQLIQRTQSDKTYAESMLAQQLAALKTAPDGASPQTLDKQLSQLQSELIQLEGRYTSDHPDVTKKKNEIAQMQKRIEDMNRAAKQEAPKPTENAGTLVESPAVVNLRNQIRLMEQTIREKTREQQRLQDQVKMFQARVQMSPVVEQEYKELTRGYDTALRFYNDFLSRKTQADIAQDLDTQQQGEQFRVIDSANLPISPSYPNKLMFAGGGLGGGVGLGLALMLLLELKDKAMRSELDVIHFLELPALAMVPSVGPAGQNGGRFWKRKPKQTGELAKA